MFVHIPKNDGSSIEEAGRSGVGLNKRNWGLYSYCPYLNKKGGWGKCIERNVCEHQEQNITIANNRTCQAGCVTWHDPDVLRFQLANKYEPVETTTNTLTFCVIRNPLEWLLSTYKYNNGRGRKGNGCSATYLNGWDQTLFQTFLPNNGNFMQCHLLRQVDFPCDRKLLFDNIEGYFDDLTEEHSLNLTLRNGNIAPTHIRR